MKTLKPVIAAALALAAVSDVASAAEDHAKWDLGKLDATKLPPAAAQKGLTYAKDVKPILEASCFNCHGEQRQRGELRLDSLEALLKGGESGKIVEAGASAKSRIVFAAAQVNDDVAMPPKRPPGGRGGPWDGPYPGGCPFGWSPSRGRRPVQFDQFSRPTGRHWPVNVVPLLMETVSLPAPARIFV